MAIPNDVDKFLQAVFGSDHGTRAIFANLQPPHHARDFKQLDTSRGCYWSIASFGPNAKTHAEAGALEVRALVIDDVGTKVPAVAVEMALKTPTAIVESSQDNFQWVYRLPKPVPLAQWKAFADNIQAKVRITLDSGYNDPVHLYRLPMGRHLKSGFAPRLVELNVKATLSLEHFKFTLAVPKARTSSPDGKFKYIRRLVALVPNNTGYHAWIARMYQIWVLAEDKEEGREVWLEFCARWKPPPISAQEHEYDPAKKWDDIQEGDTDTLGQFLLDDARQANPDEFARIMQDEARAVFDDEAVHPEVPPGRGQAQFKLGENDVILKTMENAAIGITALGVTCAYDQFHHRVWLSGADGARSKLTDHAMLLLRVELNTAYGRDFGPVHVYDAIMALALLNGFNPVTDMLAEAEKAWDKVKRLDRLGPDYFHSEDTELARRCFRKVMIAAVRRARKPGCKFDQILVTESPEGWDKSSAWAVLAGEGNFSDADILGKDARAVQEELGDIWIHEIADLSGLTRADVEHVKAFASRTNDRARPAYGRVLLDQPRQSVCVGTTNSDTYLLSQTGNRRFWPFTLDDRVELARLREDRLMLWGEAAAAESSGETLVLDKHLWDTVENEQEKRRVIDTWEDELVNLPEEHMHDWDGDQFISNLAIQEYLGGYRRQAFNSGSGRKIAEIMRRLKWKKCSHKIDGIAHRGYKRTKPITVTASVIHLKPGKSL